MSYNRIVNALWIVLAILINITAYRAYLEYSKQAEPVVYYTHSFYTCCGERFSGRTSREKEMKSGAMSFYCMKRKVKIVSSFHIQSTQGTNVHYVPDYTINNQHAARQN